MGKPMVCRKCRWTRTIRSTTKPSSSDICPSSKASRTASWRRRSSTTAFAAASSLDSNGRISTAASFRSGVPSPKGASIPTVRNSSRRRRGTPSANTRSSTRSTVPRHVAQGKPLLFPFKGKEPQRRIPHDGLQRNTPHRHQAFEEGGFAAHQDPRLPPLLRLLFALARHELSNRR